MIKVTAKPVVTEENLCVYSFVILDRFYACLPINYKLKKDITNKLNKCWEKRVKVKKSGPIHHKNMKSPFSYGNYE